MTSTRRIYARLFQKKNAFIYREEERNIEGCRRSKISSLSWYLVRSMPRFGCDTRVVTLTLTVKAKLKWYPKVIPRKIKSTRQPCDQYFFVDGKTWYDKNVSPSFNRCSQYWFENSRLYYKDSIIGSQSIFCWCCCGYFSSKYQSFLNFSDVCFSFKVD